jgi:quercetin dioxygenase-like cupin family protein
MSAEGPRRLDYCRYVTTHNDAGKAIFSNTDAVHVVEKLTAKDAKVTLDYIAETVPAQIAQNADLRSFYKYCDDGQTADSSLPNTFAPEAGLVLRHLAFPPGMDSPMHKTETLDFVVVVQGRVQLWLDGGEMQVIKQGDTVVQRATNHLWKNDSETEWAVIVAVIMSAKV